MHSRSKKPYTAFDISGKICYNNKQDCLFLKGAFPMPFVETAVIRYRILTLLARTAAKFDQMPFQSRILSTKNRLPQHQTPQQNQISIRNRAIPTLPLNRQILRFRIIMTMSLLIRTTLKQILPLRTIFREKFRSRTLPPHRIQRRKPTLHRIFLPMIFATTSRTETLPTSSNQIFRDNFSSSQLLVNPLTPTMIPTRPRIHH